MANDKEDTEEEAEKKKQSAPFWKTLPPMVMIIGGVLIFLAIRSMDLDKGGGNNYLMIIGGILLLFFFMGKSKTPEEGIITPKEAELLLERECERKKYWGQFPMMSKFFIGPVGDMQHRDTRGQYYNIAVRIECPFRKTEYYVGKVMARGEEKGFCTLIESIGSLKGRSIQQEKDITRVPEWVHRPEKYSILRDLWKI